MDRSIALSNEKVVPVTCVEERVESKGKALDVLLCLEKRRSWTQNERREGWRSSAFCSTEWSCCSVAAVKN